MAEVIKKRHKNHQFWVPFQKPDCMLPVKYETIPYMHCSISRNPVKTKLDL